MGLHPAQINAVLVRGGGFRHRFGLMENGMWKHRDAGRGEMVTWRWRLRLEGQSPSQGAPGAPDTVRGKSAPPLECLGNRGPGTPWSQTPASGSVRGWTQHVWSHPVRDTALRQPQETNTRSMVSNSVSIFGWEAVGTSALHLSQSGSFPLTLVVDSSEPNWGLYLVGTSGRPAEMQNSGARGIGALQECPHLQSCLWGEAGTGGQGANLQNLQGGEWASFD